LSPLLDLSDADLSGFEALPADTYNAEVYEVDMGETKGGDNAKLPKGTPVMNVQFRITDEEFENRRVFNGFIFAPAEIDGKPYPNKKMMDGILARFFMAIGYSTEEVTSGDFEPDFEDMKGRPCRVVVSKYEYTDPDTQEKTMRNRVKGVKPPSDGDEGGLL